MSDRVCHMYSTRLSLALLVSLVSPVSTVSTEIQEDLLSYIVCFRFIYCCCVSLFICASVPRFFSTLSTLSTSPPSIDSIRLDSTRFATRSNHREPSPALATLTQSTHFIDTGIHGITDSYTLLQSNISFGHSLIHPSPPHLHTLLNKFRCHLLSL